MREITVIRPKRMEAAAVGLVLEIDGKKVGKLGNGGQASAQIDENSHELYIHGGLLAGKAFSAKLSIPAGPHSYTFQIDMLSITNGYKPVLRPTDGARLKDTLRSVTLIGVTLTDVLLNPKLHELAAALPEARFQLVLNEDKWCLMLMLGTQRQVITESPYSQTTGGLIGATLNIIDHADLKTPEGRMKMTDQIMTEYLAYLPGFSRTGADQFIMIK